MQLFPKRKQHGVDVQNECERCSKLGETIEIGKLKLENYRTWESEDRMKTIKSKTNYAQRLSNDSELFEKSGKRYAQGVSKVSE